MIFVTLGTHEQPFGRLLDLVSELDPASEQLVVQRGATPAPPRMAAIEWHEYLDWHSLSVMMRRADVVITHAGVGSAVMAIRAGKTPVMVPRLARFGEHVDDHQLQLAERFAQRGLALACRPEDDLKALVTRARTRAPSAPAARPAELRSAVVAAASAA